MATRERVKPMAKEDPSSKHARRGPMKIVYAVILVGLVVIMATVLLTGRSPHDDSSPPVTSQGQ